MFFMIRNEKRFLLRTLFFTFYFCGVALAGNKQEISDVQAGNLFAIQETTQQIMGRDSEPTSSDIIIHYKPGQVPQLDREENKVKAEWIDEQSIARFDATTRSPQTVSTPNFTSVTLGDTLSLPPDSNGAIGPTQYLTVVNGRIRSHSKFTGAADGGVNTTLDNFFVSVRNGSRTTDPRVKFDRLTDRWYVICINVPTGSNRVLLAVSNSRTIDASTIWSFFFFEQSTVNPAGDAGLFFDFPTLGIDSNALYIGGNLFAGNGAFANSTAFVVQKTSILSGGPLVVTAFRNLVGTGGPVTPQGVLNFDVSATQGFFVGSVNSSFLALRIVSNPGSVSPTMSNAIFIPVTSFAEPLDVPSLGGLTLLDSVSGRLAEAHIRNNQLWITHNIGINSSGTSTGTIDRTAPRWYQVDLTNPLSPSIVQSGTLFDSAATNPTIYWMPSIMSSGQGHVALGFSVAGATQFANAGTVGRLANSALNTLGTPVLYTNSSTSYNVQSGASQRWGDYSITSLDPLDNMTMWTIQEFCNATNSYGCQVVKLLAPPPANVSSATPALVAQGQSSVNVQINGSSINGSGFYDPGAGFEERLVALVSGGVIVNSVTYLSPTSIIININTSFATKGIKQVIVKNPDDQQRVGNVLIVN